MHVDEKELREYLRDGFDIYDDYGIMTAIVGDDDYLVVFSNESIYGVEFHLPMLLITIYD